MALEIMCNIKAMRDIIIEALYFTNNLPTKKMNDKLRIELLSMRKTDVSFWFPRSCVVTHTEQGNIHAAEYGTSVVTFIDMRSHAERGNEGIKEDIKYGKNNQNGAFQGKSC